MLIIYCREAEGPLECLMDVFRHASTPLISRASKIALPIVGVQENSKGIYFIQYLQMNSRYKLLIWSNCDFKTQGKQTSYRNDNRACLLPFNWLCLQIQDWKWVVHTEMQVSLKYPAQSCNWSIWNVLLLNEQTNQIISLVCFLKENY